MWSLTVFLHGKWHVELAQKLTKPMFQIGNQHYTQKDFANYLAKNQHKTDKQNIIVYVDKAYKEFVNDNLVKYENSTP